MSKTLFFLLTVSSVFCQTPDTLTINNLTELWDVAMQQNSNLSIYNLKKQQNKNDQKIAKSFLLPQIGGSFNGQYNHALGLTPVPGELIGTPGETGYLQFGNKVNYNTGISISKSIFDWQQNYQSKKTKEVGHLIEAQVEAFTQSLKMQIAQNYYSLLVVQTAMDIADEDLNIAEKIVTINEQKFNLGLISEITLNQYQINYNTVVNNKLTNIELYNELHSKLIELLGLKYTSVLKFNSVHELNEPYYSRNDILGEDKTIKTLPIAIQIEEFQVKSLKSSFYPKITISRYFGYQQFQDNLSLTIDSDYWSKLNYTNLNISIPIFTGFQSSNKLKKATLEKEIKIVEAKNEIEKSRLRDLQIKNSFQNLKSIAEISYDNFKLSEKNLDLNQLKLEQGIIGHEAYLKSFEDYLKAENSYLNNLSNMMWLYAEIIARNK